MRQRNARVLHAICVLGEESEEPIALAAIEQKVYELHLANYVIDDIIRGLLDLERHSLVRVIFPSSGESKMPKVRATAIGIAAYSEAKRSKQ